MTTPPLPPEVTRDYEVVRSLGVGGQGHTMLARRRADDEVVVLKTLDFVELSSWKDLELLQREMKVLASIRHPAVPRLLAHYPEDLEGESPEAFVIIQELIEGETLEALLTQSDGPLLDEDEAEAFLGEMLGILEYLHGLNPPVVHRDIKPSNIMRRPTGEHVLIDFGAASASGVLTGSTTFVGTNGYMPPEQLMGRAEPRSDLFALGATTLELMTDMNPSNLSLDDLSFRLDVLTASAGFVNIIRVLTHPSPSRRYVSAARAREALRDPKVALVLGRESPLGLDVERRADGLVMVEFPEKRGVVTGSAATVLGLSLCLGLGLISPTGGVILAAILLFFAYRQLPIPHLELDDDELRVIWTWGPYRRTQRWALPSIAEIWTGPVPTKTGILIQQADGTQSGLRFKALSPEQHHKLGDLIRHHKEGV